LTDTEVYTIIHHQSTNRNIDMLKLMIIQRNGATTHQIVNVNTRFNDFIELVAYMNHGKSLTYNEQYQSVCVSNQTTYTMLTVDHAEELF
jgi:hypothetical protein